MKIIYHIYNSPVGDLKIATYNNQLVMCDWLYRKKRDSIDSRVAKFLKAPFEEGISATINDTIVQIEEYLKGERKKFDLPILMSGTEFQKQVWQKLIEVPFGKTSTYKQLAIAINNEKGVRAVANANGANAISIIIPCHRIIGANGSLTGYAGGLNVKLKLLNIEYNSQLSLFG